MSKGDWYPSQEQLKDPVSTERSLRRVLQIVYGMRNVSTVPSGKSGAAEPSSFISAINGLPVEPFDPTTLTDGTKLTWVAANRRFEFK
jgi:hypothetical protein